MADLHSEILNKYGVDIAQDNLFKLYKLESPDLSEETLAAKIAEAHKRWEISVNGANEKNAERDLRRLDNAYAYEYILRDAKLRKKLFNYYNKQTSGAAAGIGGASEFARDFFRLVATTKKLKKADVDFFFNYFPAERKNKKAILEMLNRDFKISGMGKKEAYTGQTEPTPAAKRKNNGSPLVVNLFQEATVLKISRVMEKYTAARQNEELLGQYPKLAEGLYDFLEINEVDNAKDFAALMTARGQEAYGVRQEKGSEYVLLLDLFNILKEMSKYQDVADNIAEFKLLLKYPALTPYMYSFVEMKPGAIKEMVKIANSSGDYAFQDETDFILNYYLPVYDNFGISNNSVAALVDKAAKKAKQGKTRKIIEVNFGGRSQKQKAASQAVSPIYWPVYVVYFVFAVAKYVFTRLHRLKIPVFVILLALFNLLFSRMFGVYNLLILRKLLAPSQWSMVVNELLGGTYANWFSMLALTLASIVLLALIYVLPAFFGAKMVDDFADDFNKRFDWGGYERTFQNLFQTIRQKSQNPPQKNGR